MVIPKKKGVNLLPNLLQEGTFLVLRPFQHDVQSSASEDAPAAALKHNIQTDNIFRIGDEPT